MAVMQARRESVERVLGSQRNALLLFCISVWVGSVTPGGGSDHSIQSEFPLPFST